MLRRQPGSPSTHSAAVGLNEETHCFKSLSVLLLITVKCFVSSALPKSHFRYQSVMLGPAFNIEESDICGLKWHYLDDRSLPHNQYLKVNKLIADMSKYCCIGWMSS